jgi:iron complex transport system substrate-binding protein
MMRYLLLAFHGTPLLLVVTFSFGLLVASKAGFAGIPLGLVLLSWFFKYCFVLLDSNVAGDPEPPVLSIEMVNPVSEQRPLLIAFLIGGECLVVTALGRYLGEVVAVLGAVVATLALPANIAVLAVTRNPFQAMWPPALFEMMKVLRRDYGLLNVLTLVAAGVIYSMWTYGASLAVALLVGQMLFLIIFSLVGGAVFEHRLELGIESRTLQERIAERDAREHQLERRRMLDRAYSGFRVRKPLEGWQEIEAWLRQHAQGENQVVEYRAVLEAASRWDDARAADRLANDFAALLLVKRANGEALEVIEQRLATNPLFQTAPPALVVRLAELAGAAGKRSLQRRLADVAKNIRAVLAFFLLVLVVVTHTGSAVAADLIVTDDTNQRVVLPAIPTRIVSLAPGATEMLFAAGAGTHVVATVEYSDEPAAARRVPRIGDVVAVDMERLVSLRPEVAVVWPGGGNPAQIAEIGKLGIRIYRQQVNTLADLGGSIRRLGALAGTGAVAEQAARNIEARLATLARTYNDARHPSVMLEVWNHPIYTVGGTHLMSDVLRLCGARNVFGDLRDLGPAVDVEAVVARNPDIIVAAAPPGSGKDWLADWKRFGALRAVREGNLIAFEDQRLTRLGPSVVDATEGLCKALAAAH